MPRSREPEPVVDDSKRWLESYADAITLLLAFFIMMFAFSLVDKEKFIDFKFGVAQALGKPNPTVEGGLGLLDRGNGIASYVAQVPSADDGEDGTDGVHEPQPTPEDDSTDFTGAVDGEVTREELPLLARELRDRLDRLGVSDRVHLRADPRGLIVHVDDSLLFDSGSALIRPEALGVLDAVGAVLATIDNQIIVEGHTDNVPTRGIRWPTNWELSAGRATSVLRYLIEQTGLPPVRMAAAGYADTRPVAPNSTPEGRQRNRRVEIIVVVPSDPDGGGDPPPLAVIPEIDPGAVPPPAFDPTPADEPA